MWIKQLLNGLSKQQNITQWLTVIELVGVAAISVAMLANNSAVVLRFICFEFNFALNAGRNIIYNSTETIPLKETNITQQNWTMETH